MLAQLFKLPDNYGSAESLAGLQTVASVQQLLNGRAAAGGPNAGQAMQQGMQQGMQQAQAQLKSLKDKINKLGGNSSNMDMHGFTPNVYPNLLYTTRLCIYFVKKICEQK
jgi:hypothetical protein